MKYKGVLIFLIFCLIVVSCALITFAIMSKDTKNVSNNANISNNTNTSNSTNDNNITNESKNVTNNSDENLENDANISEENNETSKEEPSKEEEKSNSEEESKETGKSKKEKQDIALNLTKKEWGEDDTVYYTIDREVGNVYDISVRSKSTTETLAEYEVDIANKTVQIK